MRSSSLLTAWLVIPGLAFAGPLRVLYLGSDAPEASRHAHVLMRDLGRDAIWLEYRAAPSEAGKELTAGFDVVVVDQPSVTLPQRSDAPRWIRAAFTDDEAASVKGMREAILAAAGPERVRTHQAFLDQREPERREPSPHVANYEKRPQPITFQHPFSPKGSMERTQVAPDLRLELFASEPDIGKPIALAWDERGRCWIAETADYPHGVKEDGVGQDAIKICEDTNGDGKADKFTVFADKLNLPTSLVFSNGGLIVAQPPRFLFLQDTDGDDRADVRREIMTGWGIGDTHAQASNLHYGFDNWLHGCVGYSAFKGQVGGRDLDFRMGTYRFRPDGSAMEFLHQFTNNSWAQSQNRAGDDFGGTANGAPLFFGGIPAGAWPEGQRGLTAKKINLVPDVHTITPNYRQVDVFGGYTAAAGSSFIDSPALPPRLQGMAMVCEPTMKVIALMDVRPDGAGYVARDGFNLVASSDEWMSPVCAEVGPDGAVWFADFQNFIIQHNPTPSVGRGGYDAKTGPGGAHENPLRDHRRGRIYRVTWKDAPRAAPTRLQGANADTLVNALSNGVMFWRMTAQRLLVQGRVEGAIEALRKRVTANDGSIAAVHALWALQGLGALDTASHRAALLASDPILRRNAARALPATAEGLSLLSGSGVVSDPVPAVRLAALVSLAAMPTTPELRTLVRGLARDPAVASDEWLSEAARLLTRRHQAQPFREGPNLLPNPGFEEVGSDGLPAGWKRRDYGNAEQKPGNGDAEWKLVTDAHTGARSIRCITRKDADTSLYADVALKPHTRYRLSGWIKTHALRGKASFNDHIGRAETARVTLRESGWGEVDVEFDSGDRTRASINVLHVASGDAYFDDVRLSELLPHEESAGAVVGDAARGRELFWKHPTAACSLCHMLGGKGSTVGPALDGIASRKDAAYLTEALVNPNARLAEGFQALGASPMPPMGLVLTPQELEDVKAFLGTLK